MLSLRLKASVPLLVTLVDVPSVPVVVPLPICSVPALIVVEPLQSLSADSVVVPVPACVTVPVPEILAPTTKAASVRLNTKAVLLVMTPVPNAPEVPALPICRVPPLMVVVPVKLLAPERIFVPVPFLVKLKAPLMTPLNTPPPLLLPILRRGEPL